MIELHVWGKDDISLIDPESRAAAWLLSLHLTPQKVEFEIVPSSNTNLADTAKLPLLKVGYGDHMSKYEGYCEIVSYICDNYANDTKFIPDGRLSSHESLINLTLTNYIISMLDNLNQYNLFVKAKNYDLYTRKAISSYLPFPMMYNQPLKMYYSACERVKTVGLGPKKTGLFESNDEDVANTESVSVSEDEADDQATVAVSALHEKMILGKEKNKALLRETKYTLRCLRLLDKYVSHIQGLFSELNTDSPVEFAYLFRPKRVSSSELLLYSYFFSLTNSQLPEQYISNYLEKNFHSFWSFANTIVEALNKSLESSHFRPARGSEIPSLRNEVAYMLGINKY